MSLILQNGIINTSDADKPVSTATQTALNLKANLASPTFTGTPLSTTAAVDTNTTQIATTAYVFGQGYAKLASPTFTGTPTLPTGTIGTTQTAGNSTTAIATTAFVTTGYVALTGNQTIAGNKTLSGQTELTGQAATNSTSAMTRGLGDTRYREKSVTSPTATYSSNSGANNFYETEFRRYTVSGVDRVYVSGHFNIATQSTPALQVAEFGGYTASNALVISGDILGQGVFDGRFSASTNGVSLMANNVSGRLKLWNSGAASNGYRYKFNTNFAASAGDTIVMSPSGHTFTIDKTITDATVWTDKDTGGVFVRNITGNGNPSGSDTSLMVNGGSPITTTFVANTATNTSTAPIGLLFPSTTGWYLWNSTFTGTGRIELYYRY